MSRATVGKWGKNLAIRVPLAIARDSGLNEGEHVEVEARDGDIVIRRPEAKGRRRREAQRAAQEIINESRHHSLGGISIEDLLNEGRRG